MCSPSSWFTWSSYAVDRHSVLPAKLGSGAGDLQQQLLPRCVKSAIKRQDRTPAGMLRLVGWARITVLLPLPDPVLQLTVRDALNSALDEEMTRDDKVYILGEEVRSFREQPCYTTRWLQPGLFWADLALCLCRWENTRELIRWEQLLVMLAAVGGV